jgi:hypothetical protein
MASSSFDPLEEYAMESLAKLVQRVGPYLVIAIVVPGGTFVALGLYLYRQPVARRALSALGGGFNRSAQHRS